MEIRLRAASPDDVGLLADMNKRLIEDEGSSNPLDREQLQARMRNWLEADWKADFLMCGEETAGYALYRFKENDYHPGIKEVYLRQYFVGREHRGKGLGLQGVALLKELRFKGVATIEIDVLEENRLGKSFWLRAGFEPYACNMRMRNT